MGRAGGAFDTDWMFAQLAAPDRCEPEAASAAQSMNGRYAQKAVFAKFGERPIADTDATCRKGRVSAP
jgi:hypothetical protein